MSKTPTPASPTIQIGSISIETGTSTVDRMAILLWGPATAGKTTFAATAPGKKLWLSFGDNEHVSVASRADVLVAPIYKLDRHELFKHAQNDNPFGLDRILSENREIETVVVDSVTALEYRALQKSVLDDKVGAGRGFTPSMEAPGIAAYGGRNAIVLEVLTGILRVTAKHNVHVILCAHEADPTMKQEGQVETIDFYGINLGGKLVNNVTWRLSEIWYLSQDGQDRRLMIRPTRKRRPCKSRLFAAKDAASNPVLPEYPLLYDPDQPDETQLHTIAHFFDLWLDADKQRILFPQAEPQTKAKAKR